MWLAGQGSNLEPPDPKLGYASIRGARDNRISRSWVVQSIGCSPSRAYWYLSRITIRITPIDHARTFGLYYTLASRSASSRIRLICIRVMVCNRLDGRRSIQSSTTFSSNSSDTTHVLGSTAAVKVSAGSCSASYAGLADRFRSSEPR